MEWKVPVGISNHHVHLTKETYEQLFCEKIEKLKSTLEKDPTIQELKRVQEEIKKDENLLVQLKNKEKETENNEKIRKMQLLENQVNFIILEINKRLKENIGKNSRCQNENH